MSIDRTVLAGLAAASLAASAPGVEIPWAAAVSGEFSAGGNWIGGVTPGATDTAVFAMPGGYIVTLAADRLIGGVEIDGSSPVFDFSGATLESELFGMTPPALTLSPTAGAVSDLLLVGGTLSGREMFIAEGQGSVASVTVASAGTRLEAIDQLEIGQKGLGTLEVIAGGALDSDVTFIGRDEGSDGRLTVRGSGSSLTATLVRVAMQGDGVFEVLEGATADTQRVVVSSGLGVGSVTVSGAGSGLDARPAEIFVGDNGMGTMTVSAGGTVQSLNLIVGDEGGNGSVDFQGGSGNFTNEVVIGRGGTAAASIGAGSLVLTNAVRIGAGNTSLGELTVRGTLLSTTSVQIAPGAFSIGSLTLQPGGVVDTGSLTVFPNGSLEGEGLVTANATSAGTVSPAGALTIDGTYSQSSALGNGTLLVDLDGTGRTLVVTGAATLAGQLRLNLSPGFQPQTGETFTVLSAGSISGAFGSIVTPSVDWTVEIVGGDVVATFTGTPPMSADLDGDGVVGSGDLGILLAAWGGAGGAADLDGDGVVGSGDLGILLAEWGS